MIIHVLTRTIYETSSEGLKSGRWDRSVGTLEVIIRKPNSVKIKDNFPFRSKKTPLM